MMSRILVVRATFYREIADFLLEGASAALKDKGAFYEVLDVPGAMEIPLAMAGASSDFDGYLALGCVIRGETSHYDVVCQTSANGLMTLALSKNMLVETFITMAVISFSEFELSSQTTDPKFAMTWQRLGKPAESESSLRLRHRG